VIKASVQTEIEKKEGEEKRVHEKGTVLLEKGMRKDLLLL